MFKALPISPEARRNFAETLLARLESPSTNEWFDAVLPRRERLRVEWPERPLLLRCTPGRVDECDSTGECGVVRDDDEAVVPDAVGREAEEDVVAETVGRVARLASDLCSRGGRGARGGVSLGGTGGRASVDSAEALAAWMLSELKYPFWRSTVGLRAAPLGGLGVSPRGYVGSDFLIGCSRKKRSFGLPGVGPNLGS